LIRAFTEADGEAVDKLYAACHPTWPAKPSGYWWGHPTLVLEMAGEVIGSTSCTISFAPAETLVKLLRRDRAEVGWGHGVYVMPQQRGKGYGWELAQARHQALLSLGINFFFGMTQPDNVAMMAIFKRQQLTRSASVPNAYPDGRAAVLYHGGIV
jgi:GNAT superfamily N-acetyltransferase